MRRILFFFLVAVFLVIVAEVLLFSPRDVKNVQRDKILETEIAEKTPENQSEASQLLTDLELMEAGDKGKEWTLRSKHAALYENNNEWRIKGVEVKLYGQSGTHYLVTGEKGRVDIETKDIWVEGDVKIESSNGYLIETSEVNYLGADRRLVSDKEVLLFGPADNSEDEPGSERLQVSGVGLSAELESNRIYLLNNVKANKPMKEGMLMAIQSESAEFSGNNKLTKFIRSVIIVIIYLKILL